MAYQASGPHLDLLCALYVVYGVQHTDLVSLNVFQAKLEHLEAERLAAEVAANIARAENDEKARIGALEAERFAAEEAFRLEKEEKDRKAAEQARAENETNALVAAEQMQAGGSRLDLSRPPCVFYGAKYVDLVSLDLFQARLAAEQAATLERLASDSHLDLGRAPYCYDLYGVKCIDLVSPARVPS